MSSAAPDGALECRWEYLLPREFRVAFAALPVVFLPLGTVEWHGEHNALGLDSVKAHALCCIAAQKAGGGIVHPPVYGGMGGLDKPATVILEPEMAWENLLLRPWLEKLCYEFHRLGFQGIVIVTGHYGHNQQIVVREVGARMTERLGIPVLGTPEYWLAHDAGYLGDHAGIGETSLLWHLRPELVDIARLDDDPEYGADDKIRHGASPERGRQYADLITERLAAVARAMPGWDAPTRDAFARAEAALVRAQVTRWRREPDAPWASWGELIRRKEFGYGALLAEGRFAEIEQMAARIA
jgi:creatinine amidohydrolase